MKKLLFVLLVSAAALVSFQNADARYRYAREKCGGCRKGCAPKYECGPIPCCERQELVTVRVPAVQVCGWVCPPGTEEVGAESDNPCCK